MALSVPQPGSLSLEDYVKMAGKPSGSDSKKVSLFQSDVAKVTSPQAALSALVDLFSPSNPLADFYNNLKSDVGGFLSNAAKYIGDNASSWFSTLENVVSDVSGTFQDFADQYSLGVDAANKHAAQMAANANQFAHDEAELNRQWQERMSNTSFQRARADAEAAGFNPILGYTQGGAAVPSGSAASASMAQSFKSSDVTDTVMMISALVSTVLKSVNSAIRTAKGK